MLVTISAKSRQVQIVSRQIHKELQTILIRVFSETSNFSFIFRSKPTEAEIIEALRCHYPFEIQRALVQTNTIRETLEVLRRLELLETQEHSRIEMRNTNQVQEDRNTKYRSLETKPLNKDYRNYHVRNRNEYRSRGNLSAENNARIQYKEESWDDDPKTLNYNSGN
jgi:hypothetical protein